MVFDIGFIHQLCTVYITVIGSEDLSQHKELIFFCPAAVSFLVPAGRRIDGQVVPGTLSDGDRHEES